MAQAVEPALPDGGYAGDNTAEGENALFSLTTVNGDGMNNTAMGSEALSSNTIGSNNTAVGATSLYSNTDGGENTAIGRFALYTNSSGNSNTAREIQHR